MKTIKSLLPVKQFLCYGKDALESESWRFALEDDDLWRFSAEIGEEYESEHGKD